MNWKLFWELKANSAAPALQVGRVVNGVQMNDALLAKIAARVAEELDLQPIDSLLDVCCGNGALTRALLPYCKEIVGIDFSEKLIQQAQNYGDNINLVIAKSDGNNGTKNNLKKGLISDLNIAQNDKAKLGNQGFGLNQHIVPNEEQKLHEQELGSDLNIAQNDKAKLKGELLGSKLKYVCGDAQNFVVEQRFNKLVLYFSFQYFESQEMGKRVIENLIRHAKPGAKILLGDVTDMRNFFSYYHSPKKISHWLKQQVTGKNDMGKFWHPDELQKICVALKVKGELIEQLAWQPYAKYRFDFLITC
ncbi:MAG: class I SAM-dependent methyltransferase [bacterium]|nr:class I SAM-dependent methyltransferase [bacterium]